jgi:hypothetical protein
MKAIAKTDQSDMEEIRESCAIFWLIFAFQKFAYINLLKAAN